MHLLPWLLSFYLPLCGTQGAAGIMPPGVVDFSHFQRASHSAFLLAPAGFQPAPDQTAPIYNVPAPALFTDIRAVAAARPRIFALDTEPQALQAAWVARTAGGNFPDVIEVAVVPEGPRQSSLIFYSRSLYGWSDYGVNGGRARIWLKILQTKVKQ